MKTLGALLAAAALGACTAGSDVPGGPGGGGGGSTDGIPEALSKNLNAAVYNPRNQTLTVELQSLDASPFTATYTRNAALDVNGYEAYEVSETSRQRHFVALFKTSARGTVSAGVVADGGKNNRYFNGGIYSRVSLYTAPTSGLASYVGSYAGLISYNGGTTGVPPVRVSGKTEITADFSDSFIEGNVTNRKFEGGALPGRPPLEDIALTVTPIADGTFAGTVEFIGAPDQTIGDYGGTFGGNNASDVAGILVFDPISGNSGVHETGVFVLPRCGTAGDAPACP